MVRSLRVTRQTLVRSWYKANSAVTNVRQRMIEAPACNLGRNTAWECSALAASGVHEFKHTPAALTHGCDPRPSDTITRHGVTPVKNCFLSTAIPELDHPDWILQGLGTNPNSRKLGAARTREDADDSRQGRLTAAAHNELAK